MESSPKNTKKIQVYFFRRTDCAFYANPQGLKNEAVYENKPGGAGGLPPFPLRLFPFFPQCLHGN